MNSFLLRDFGACYGSASMIKKNWKLPDCCTPSIKFRFTLAPAASGCASVTEIVEL